VCEPVREYLKNRGDTVRCIVASLTDSANSVLSKEVSSKHFFIRLMFEKGISFESVFHLGGCFI
jgi:hypothetical protein